MSSNQGAKIVELLSPLTGRILPLEKVPDQVFAQKMLGEGLAIDPLEEVVLAPADGRVETIFPTGHAIVLNLKTGGNLLIHIGIGTAKLEKAFNKIVQVGEEVKKGQLLIKFNLEIIRQEAESALSPVIILNPFPGVIMDRRARDLVVKAGEDTLFMVSLKGESRDGYADFRSQGQ
ncbi:PTS sugar transporter subunit IIA [Thermanaeromonas toyohensis]|uniref:PTS sugar transporter subunit IIA n=1 Tax=Thermanaeromonas toyohensis TaxID=161154 RepID=UPI0009FD29AB|nr:PTS glucose transporter subunit IIA [Thermanaeromonas toyohensis]